MEFSDSETTVPSTLNTFESEDVVFPDYPDALLMISAVVYGLQGILSIVLNGFSLFVLSRDPSIMEETELILIRALSALDLLSGVYMSSVYTFMTVSPTVMISNPVVCGATQAINILLSGQTQLMLMLLTLDKYMRITKPLKYLHWINPFRAKVLVTTAYILPVPVTVVGALPKFLFTALKNQCVSPFHVNQVVIFTCGYLFVLLVISVILNAHILLVVRKKHKRISNMPGIQAKDQRGSLYKGPLTMFTLNAVSYTVWLTWAFSCLASLKFQSTLPLIQMAILSFLWQLTAWCNPIIMLITNRSYRKIVKRVLLK